MVEKGHPEQAATDEGSEMPLIGNLNLQAKAPKKQLGQPAVAGDEGIEVPLFDQPKSPGKSTKKTVSPANCGSR